MSGAKSRQSWTPNQIKLMRFVARGKKTKPTPDHPEGQRRTMQQFADAIGVSRDALYDWMAIPGFKNDMFELSIARDIDKLPQIKHAVIGKSLGLKDFKNVDIPAANLATKLFGVGMERQQIESTVDAKVEANHTFANVPDEELDSLIRGAK